jgi:hypothetical protein
MGLGEYEMLRHILLTFSAGLGTVLLIYDTHMDFRLFGITRTS